MDPTATLNAIRLLVQAIELSSSMQNLAELATDLAEVVSALDKWMAKGGFLPTQWRPPS
jgi:hypothetical protein